MKKLITISWLYIAIYASKVSVTPALCHPVCTF